MNFVINYTELLKSEGSY